MVFEGHLKNVLAFDFSPNGLALWTNVTEC